MHFICIIELHVFICLPFYTRFVFCFNISRETREKKTMPNSLFGMHVYNKTDSDSLFMVDLHTSRMKMPAS